MPMVRIQKLLASWGVASRRSVENYIKEGRIAVNGKKLDELGLIIDENNLPSISLDGKKILPKVNIEHSIFVFNKPKFVITSLKDERNRTSIADFLPKNKRLYPIGRLDYDSTGLLLITDYGELTNRLLHPSFKVPKEYVVKIEGEDLTQEEMKRFASGVKLEEGVTAPCMIKRLEAAKCYSVIVREGHKRQIRRMFEAFERKVAKLHRISFGPVKLGDLPSGRLRPVTKEEKNALLKAVGLTPV